MHGYIEVIQWQHSITAALILLYPCCGDGGSTSFSFLFRNREWSPASASSSRAMHAELLFIVQNPAIKQIQPGKKP
jgi:hypothetical protein